MATHICETCDAPFQARPANRRRYCCRGCVPAHGGVPASPRGKRHDHPLYATWRGMIQRCTNRKHPHWQRYGGRGIQVCERWLSDFWNFVDDMGERPDGHTIDRIDNDGNYEPGNCRWASGVEQQRNRSNTGLTHCSKGHEFTPANTYMHRGKRHCRACRKGLGGADVNVSLQAKDAHDGERSRPGVPASAPLTGEVA